MNISEPFIHRPVATALLTAAIALAGAAAFRLLPVAPLPQVDFPTISVSAALPGASPETVASSIATPLERQLGHIAYVTEMTSNSTLGSTSITLQFDLNRDINAAAADVQAAINAARAYLPANIPNNPTYRKVNPADSPIFIIALTSDVLSRGAMYDAASTIMAQRLSQVSGVGQVIVGGSTLPSVRIELNPTKLNKLNIGLEQVRSVLSSANANTPKGQFSDGERTYEIAANDQLFKAADYAPLIVAWRNGAPVRISDIGEAVDYVQDVRNAGFSNGKPSVLVIGFRSGAHAGHLRDPRRSGRLCVSAQPAHHVHPQRCRAGLADRNVRRDVPARLQPRQSFIDGAHDLHRFRRRRRHRGHRKYHALSRTGGARIPGRAQRSPRNRLHRAVNQPFAHRCFYSLASDGRNRRPPHA